MSRMEASAENTNGMQANESRHHVNTAKNISEADQTESSTLKDSEESDASISPSTGHYSVRVLKRTA